MLCRANFSLAGFPILLWQRLASTFAADSFVCFAPLKNIFEKILYIWQNPVIFRKNLVIFRKIREMRCILPYFREEVLLRNARYFSDIICTFP